jgi:hypothetical protein
MGTIKGAPRFHVPPFISQPSLCYLIIRFSTVSEPVWMVRTPVSTV